jgi:parallel beta-helix repeat protein
MEPGEPGDIEIETLNFLDIISDFDPLWNPERLSLVVSLPTIDHTEQRLLIDRSVFITSNCHTQLKCRELVISAPDVSLAGFDIQGSVSIEHAYSVSLSNCRFHDSESDDLDFLAVRDSTSVYLSHLTFSGTDAVAALSLAERSSVRASHLFVENLTTTFIFVYEQSSLDLYDSTLRHSAANLVMCCAGSTLVLSRCLLSDSAFPAIFVKQSTCDISDTTIRNVGQTAIALNHSSSFSVGRSFLEGVSSSGISALDHCTGRIFDNHIRRVQGNGIHVGGSSSAIIEGNTIEEGNYPAVAVLTRASATISNNTIRGIDLNGLCLRGAREVTIANCAIDNSGQCGISISDTETSRIVGCTITNCKLAAVECYNHSNSIVTGTTISQCACGFFVYTAGVLEASENTLRTIEKSIARLSDHGSATVVNNRCIEVLTEAECETSQSYIFRQNDGFPGRTNSPMALTDGMVLDEVWAEGPTDLCRGCKQKLIDCFLVECGHRVYCQECAHKVKDSKGQCPVCRFFVTGVTTGFEASQDGFCLICMERQPNSVIVPCGHLGFCRECLQTWYESNSTCPTCRTEPSTFKRLD